jgi:hypothetical protein
VIESPGCPPEIQQGESEEQATIVGLGTQSGFNPTYEFFVVG